MKKRAKTFTISAVAEEFELHPQTLRLYEREGLLKPSRSEGNTRLYTDADLERLELILSLTRDLGVNLAGVEIILNMREKMDAMQREFERFFDYLQSHAEELTTSPSAATLKPARWWPSIASIVQFPQDDARPENRHVESDGLCR